MWELLIQSITDKLRVLCNVLSFIIPYTVYKLNVKLHELGDAPWQRKESGNNE